MKPSRKTLTIGIILFLACGSLVQADDVYVSNTGAGTITQINSSGSASIFASGLDGPEGLAFDSAGNLYVADSGNGTISKIDPAGNVSTFVSGLSGPSALAFDSNGNLCVATPDNQTILKIDSSGNVSVFATGMSFCGDGAYLTSDNAGNIYANTEYTVERFDSNGNRSTFWSDISVIEGMAFDSAGNVYVARQNGGAIVHGAGVLNTSILDYPAPYNNDPDEDYIWDAPCDLAFDANGNLYAYFAAISYKLSNGFMATDAGVVIEFGVNGYNSVVATDIVSGTGDFGYIAVQSVPEPGIWTMLLMGLGALLVGCRFRRCSSSFTALVPGLQKPTRTACQPRSEG